MACGTCLSVSDLALTPRVESVLMSLNIKTPTLSLFRIGETVNGNDTIKSVIREAPEIYVILGSAVAAGDTTIDFLTLSNALSSGNVVMIGDELIRVTTNVTGSTVWNVERGFAGTTAVAHASGDVATITSDVKGECCEDRNCSKFTNRVIDNCVQKSTDCICLTYDAEVYSGEAYGSSDPETVQMKMLMAKVLKYMNASVLNGVKFVDPSGSRKNMAGGIKWYIQNFGGVIANGGAAALTKTMFDNFLETLSNRESTVDTIILSQANFLKLTALLPGLAAAQCCDSNGNANVVAGSRTVAYQPATMSSPVYFVIDNDAKDKIFAVDSNDLALRFVRHNKTGETLFMQEGEWIPCPDKKEKELRTYFTTEILFPSKIGYLFNFA